MANWINDTINSGYTVVNGSLTGTGSNKVACWLEYKVLSQSIENNATTIRFYAYLATAQNTSSYWTYCNNHTGDNRGLTKIYVDGSLVYERTNRGFGIDRIPTRTDHVTQYTTAYGDASGKKFLTILTDNASAESAAYGECIVYHNADGTRQITLSFTGNCSFSDAIGMVSGSVTMQLPTIPRSTTPSVGSITLGSAATISLSPATSSFRHTLRAKFGNRAQTTIASLTNATSVSWTPALAEANEAPNATTVAGTLYCDTCDMVFPIGSIRMTISAADASAFMGGSWVRWGSGKVPVGVDTADSNFNTVEKTGGAATEALSTAQLPAHGHSVTGSVTVNSGGAHTHVASSGAYNVGSGSGSSYKYFTNDGASNSQSIASSGAHSHTTSLSLSAGNTGSGAAHNNLQPYITCYFWKRTA